jgi:hypothetical protein
MILQAVPLQAGQKLCCFARDPIPYNIRISIKEDARHTSFFFFYQPTLQLRLFWRQRLG